MPTLEEGIISFLNTREEMRNLTFSTGPFFDGESCRIFPGTVAENAILPAMAYARVGGAGSTMTMSGPDGLKKARIQFTAIGTTYADAATLLGVLTGVPGQPGLFDGFRGDLPNGVVVQLSSLITDPIDSYVDQVKLFLRHVDISFIHEI
ncbi:MAG TPA: hypothetical protein VGK36_08810 [Candidatus Angelobacter sp.]|jgi:hypothetical protein